MTMLSVGAINCLEVRLRGSVERGTIVAGLQLYARGRQVRQHDRMKSIDVEFGELPAPDAQFVRNKD